MIFICLFWRWKHLSYINFYNFPWKASTWENWWKITRTASDNRIRESQIILFAQFIFEQLKTVQWDTNWKQCCLIIIHGVKYTQFQTVTKNVFEISTQKTPSENSVMICKLKFKVLPCLAIFSSFKFILLGVYISISFSQDLKKDFLFMPHWQNTVGGKVEPLQ